MLNYNEVAERAVASGEANTAVACRPDWRSSWRGVVGALVCADRIEHRMPAARIEVRADAEDIQRASQKRLAHTLAFGIVVALLAVGVDIAHRSEDLTLINEARSEDIAMADEFAIKVLLFIKDAELITRAWI